MRKKRTDFHRMFGLAWADFCEGSSAKVGSEVDMSRLPQYLDVAIECPQPIPFLLPDGFEDMGTYNAFTFKSYQEVLDEFALWEVIHHFISYFKEVTKNGEVAIPVSDFRIYAVCVRSPQILNDFLKCVPVKSGVYDVYALTKQSPTKIRLIVIHELPQEQQNAMLLLFSAQVKAVQYGFQYFQGRSTATSGLICSLFRMYQEDPVVSNELKEFAEQTMRELLDKMPVKERLRNVSVQERLEGVSVRELLEVVPPRELLKGVPTKERLEGVPTKERLEGVPTKERLEGVPTKERLEGVPTKERLEGLSPDELLRALSPEAVDALARKLRTNGAGSHDG